MEETHLVSAVENDEVELVRNLIESHADMYPLTMRLSTGDMVIHRAAGSPRTLRLLVDLNADVNAVTANWHGLHDVDDDDSKNSDDDEEQLERGKKEANLTTLHLSAASGHVECVRVLTKASGINVNARDGEGSTPLHLASTGGHLECVISLLAHGAKCQVPDHWGNTALHEAAWNGEIECCLALLAAGADLTKPGNERKTAADLADDDNYFECSSLLRNLEGCWNTALVAQLMLDVRQMSKRESRIATHMQDHAERFQELEKNILRVVKDEERKHVVTVEAEVKEIQNSTNNLIRGIEKKIIRNEDKQTSMLSRISALDTEVALNSDHIQHLRRVLEQSSSSQSESTILASLSELQIKFSAMMETLGDKLSNLEKKIQAVENSVSRGDQLPISREDLDDLELVGRKKKPKRKSGPVPPPSSSHDDEGSNLVEVAESRALETSPKFLSSHDLSPCQMNYPFPTPGSSVSADTPSPGPADHDLDTSVMLKSRSTTKEVIKSPGKDNVAAQEFKEFHLEFLRSTANEKFSEAIGDCVQTVAKLKDSLRLVTDQTRPSTSQVQAALGQWQSALEGLMDQQNAYLESIARWAEDDAPIRDAPRLPNIAPMPNAPEVDLRIIAEQLASLHLAAKHKATSFD